MLRLALVLAMLVIAGCGGADDAAGGDPEGTEGVPGAGPDPTPAAVTVTGTLGGDGSLEGGCAWLDTGDERYEVLWPEGYEVAFEPVRLLDADGQTLAGDGDEVTVEGAPAEGMASICQVGPLFRADQVLEPG